MLNLNPIKYKCITDLLLDILLTTDVDFYADKWLAVHWLRDSSLCQQFIAVHWLEVYHWKPSVFSL